jgi:hypothetical protein
MGTTLRHHADIQMHTKVMQTLKGTTKVPNSYVTWKTTKLRISFPFFLSGSHV